MNKKNRRYMLDTNTVSYLLKGSQAIRNRLCREPMSNIHISVITEAELLYGIAKKPGARFLQKIVGEFLERVEVLPWDRTVSGVYAKLRAATEAKGKILGNLDLLIAAHSLAAETVLVTSDSSFYQVKELALDDWTKS